MTSSSMSSSSSSSSSSSRHYRGIDAILDQAAPAVAAQAMQSSAVTKRMTHASCGDRRQAKRPFQEEHAHLPPRKRLRWKQPAPSGSGQPPANSSRGSTGDGHSAVERSITLESSDGSHLAAEPMCFRGVQEKPDDAIRFEKPYLPETDFPIWEFMR